MNIHPTAIIHPGAQLGQDVTVGPFAFIDDGATIGDRSVLGPHAVVLRYTTLGEECRVHAGAVLGDLPQDLAFKDVPSFVRIGRRCVFREGVTVHRGTKEGSATEIGDECYFMANAHVAHNCRLASRVILANGALLGGYVEIAERVFISGNALVHQFVRIGRLAMMGGAAGVSKDVPPFCTVRSKSVNAVVGLNTVGLRRAGLSPAERLTIRQAFKVLYVAGLNVSAAVAELERQFPAGPAAELAAFVRASRRGICRYSGSAAGGDEAEED